MATNWRSKYNVDEQDNEQENQQTSSWRSKYNVQDSNTTIDNNWRSRFTSQPTTTPQAGYSPSLGYNVGRQISQFETNEQQRKQEVEQRKEQADVMKTAANKRISEIDKEIEELVGGTSSFAKAINIPKLNDEERKKYSELQAQREELERTSSPGFSGFIQGYTPFDVEESYQQRADIVGGEGTYQGEELQQSLPYQRGQMAGQFAKYGTAYALGGGAVGRAASKIPGLGGSGVAATLGREFAKDVVLGQPLAYQEARQQGLNEPSEVATYMGQQAIVDMIANGVFVGGGKLLDWARVAGDTQITKASKQLAVQYNLPEENVYRAMKSITSNDRELARQFNSDGILKQQYLDNVYNQSQTIAKQSDSQVRAFKPGVNIEEPTPRSTRTVAQIDRLGTKLKALDAGLESKELEQLVVKQNDLKASLNDADIGTKAYERTIKQINELDTQIKNKINEVDRLTDDISNLTKKEQGMTIESLQQKRTAIKKEYGRAIREFENDTLAYVQKVERQATTAQPKFKKAVQEILAPIDTIAKSMNTPTQIRIEGMEDYLVKQGITNSDDVLKLSASQDFVDTLKRQYKVETPYEIEQAFKRLDGKKISEMTVDDLSDLQDTLQYIIHKQETGESFINSKRLNTNLDVIGEIRTNNFNDTTEVVRRMDIVEELANIKRSGYEGDFKSLDLADKTMRQTIRDIGNTVETTRNYISGATGTRPIRALRPETIIKELANFDESSGAYKVWLDLVDGNRNRYTRLQKAELDLKAIKNSFQDVDLANRQSITFTIDGNPQTIDLTKGQRLNLYLHSKNSDNLKHLRESGFTLRDGTFKQFKKPVKIDENSMQAIIDSLSDADKAYADEIFNYVNSTFKDSINNTSIMLDGVTKANVDNYWTIMADKDFMSTGFSKVTSGRTFETASMLKERLGNKAPLRIMDIDDVFRAQAQTVANYEGLAIPIRNAKMVFGNTDVKTAMRNMYGDRADSVMKNFIQDLDESRIVDRGDFGKLTDKIIGNARQAILGANPKVIANQVASLPNAMAEVSPRHFIGINPLNLPSNELLEKYSSELWWRNKGYVTREVGDITMESGESLWTAGIKKSDNAAIRTIWRAVENETLATQQFRQGSDEFYQAVARRVEDVIHKTQPNWDALYRSDIARTTNPMEKLATMFTTQRNQNFNMMYEGYRKYLNSGNVSDLIRPVSTVIAGSLAIGGIDYGAKQLLGRDTEEGEYAKSVVSSFVSNSYIGSILYQTLLQGYDVNNVLESSLNPMFRTLQKIPNGKFMEDKGRFVRDLVTSTSTVFGIPVNNMEKWLLPIVREVNTDAYLDYQMNIGNYERTDLYSDFYNEITKPDDERDIDRINSYIEQMRKNGVEPTGLKSSVSSRNSKNEEGRYVDTDSFAFNFYLRKLEEKSNSTDWRSKYN